MDLLKALTSNSLFWLEARQHNCRQISSLLLWCCWALHSSSAYQRQSGCTLHYLKKINMGLFSYSSLQFICLRLLCREYLGHLKVMWLVLVLSLFIFHTTHMKEGLHKDSCMLYHPITAPSIICVVFLCRFVYLPDGALSTVVQSRFLTWQNERQNCLTLSSPAQYTIVWYLTILCFFFMLYFDWQGCAWPLSIHLQINLFSNSRNLSVFMGNTYLETCSSYRLHILHFYS